MGRHHDERSVDPAHARQVFRLPINSDPLFLWTSGVAFVFFVAVSSSDDPDPAIPPLLDGILAAVVMGFVFGVVPALIRLALTRRKLTRLPHLAQVAPTDVVEQLRQSGPFPLASAVRPHDGMSSPDERFRSLLDTGQTAGVCVATFLLAIARRDGFRLDATDPALRSLRRSMIEPDVPFDAWSPLCIPLLEEVWTGCDAHLAAALRALDADRRALRGALPAGTSRGEVERSRRALDRVLRMATLLGDTGWLLVDEISPRADGLFAVTAVAATGDDPDFPLVVDVVDLDTVMTSGGVAARGSDDDWVRLDPWVMHRQVANGRRLIYYFEQCTTDGSATYRSFSTGSRIVVPDRAHEIQSVARQVFGP